MKSTNSRIALLNFDQTSSILYEKIISDVEIDLAKTKEHLAIINKLTEGEKHLALIDANDYFFAENEALEFIASSNTGSSRLAIAIYTKNLSNRLTLLYFKLIYKPNTPIAFFNTENEAMNWLLSIKEVAKPYHI